MARLVEMPKLSPTMEEGQIATWHAKEGDTVDVDDLLAEVETDKATMEFRSFDRGVLLKILAGDGAIVKLGDPVAIIGAQGEDISGLLARVKSAAPTAAKAASPPPEPASAAEPAPAAPRPPPAEPAGPAPTQAPSPSAAPVASTGPGGRVKASPYVRKLARERDLDLKSVAGSGPGGRIVARDLTDARPARAPATAQPSEEPEIRPLSMMRRTIAKRLTQSKQTVPHFYLTIDVDAGPLVGLRSQLNADLERAPEPAKVSFNDLVVKAVAIAMRRSPTVNASYSDEALIYHRRVDISVAVAVDEGLVTPVLRNADQKSVLELASELRDLAARARAKKLTSEEMSGGTFSVSNLGMYGIDEFAAVINPPEGAILAIGGIRREAVVEGDQVVPGHRMKLTLSCDHRVVDGAVGAQFLSALREVLERPTQILAY